MIVVVFRILILTLMKWLPVSDIKAAHQNETSKELSRILKPVKFFVYTVTSYLGTLAHKEFRLVVRPITIEVACRLRLSNQEFWKPHKEI